MVQTSTRLDVQSDARFPASSRILLCGKAFVADVSGALYWPAEDTLIVSDLGLGRSDEDRDSAITSTLSGRQVTLSKLSQVVARYQPARLIVIGDSVPDVRDIRSIDQSDLTKLRTMQDGVDWCWVAESRDETISDMFGGSFERQVELNGMTFRDKPVGAAVSHEIAGRMKPKARLPKSGRETFARCFAATSMRLVMPEFTESDEGANILGQAFAPILGNEPLFVWVMGWDDVYPVAARQLLDDR